YSPSQLSRSARAERPRKLCRGVPQAARETLSPSTSCNEHTKPFSDTTSTRCTQISTLCSPTRGSVTQLARTGNGAMKPCNKRRVTQRSCGSYRACESPWCAATHLGHL